MRQAWQRKGTQTSRCLGLRSAHGERERESERGNNYSVEIKRTRGSEPKQKSRTNKGRKGREGFMTKPSGTTSRGNASHATKRSVSPKGLDDFWKACGNAAFEKLKLPVRTSTTQPWFNVLRASIRFRGIAARAASHRWPRPKPKQVGDAHRTLTNGGHNTLVAGSHAGLLRRPCATLGGPHDGSEHRHHLWM